MTLKEILNDRFVQVIGLFLVLVLAIFVFILAMPAMTDFDVYALLVTALLIGIIFYFYRQRKEEYEKEVRESYEQFLKEKNLLKED